MKKKNTDFATQIIELKNTDQQLRQQLIELGKLSDGYNREWRRCTVAMALNEIIETIFLCKIKAGSIRIFILNSVFNPCPIFLLP
ncbi:hypothetical protein [Xanthocytophaga agilis]|uniref:Uncharacterized protein n=1 Tax=Xanthocytophaga agilis TaxID=3048010 RepID=A0AAE3R0T8_9BACT|nr:hypothetical protein [Xanthocytophaga agilis]MDJ1501626.1 hypothetical protein [Xanthocytophaga agilis]